MWKVLTNFSVCTLDLVCFYEQVHAYSNRAYERTLYCTDDILAAREHSFKAEEVSLIG